MFRSKMCAAVLLSVLAAACGSKSSPTAPSGGGASTPTRIITVAGDLSFGNVNIGQSSTKSFTVTNSGNATLTFTSIACSGGTGPTGYVASQTSGTIASGATLTISIRFTPETAGFLSCVLKIVGDQTSGNDAINVSGTGVNPNPIFTKSGFGNTVFDMPSYVSRVRVTGVFVDTGGLSNFIVRRNGSLMINEILRQSSYDGTHATPGGGTIEITSSGSIQWSFTEIR